MSKPLQIPLHQISKQHINSTIKTFGWITSIRSAGRAGTFIDLFFTYKTAKCLVIGQVPKNLTPHSSVTVTATVKENFSKKDDYEYELHVSDIEIYTLAPSFPLNDESSAYTLLEQGHLYLRTKERIMFLKARSDLLKFMRDFYYDGSYTEVTPPTLVQTQVEGGSTLFSLKYYGEDAYLTQSSQLYLETVIASTGKAYCIAPSYRAEKFNTSRHLSEYTHVEAELGNICFDELLYDIEAFVRYVVEKFYAKYKDELMKMYPEKEYKSDQICRETFGRIKYADAIKTLVKHKVYKDKEENVEYKYGDDISDRDEIALVEILGGRPVFLTHFPVEHKPFYCRKSEDDCDLKEKIEQLHIGDCCTKKDGCTKKDAAVMKDEGKIETEYSGETTESVDLLWPGIGEILGGSMRAENYHELMEGFKREGISPAPYYWYTDLRLYGANRHGGYGLGFERFMRGMMGYENVNKACLYPRFPGRCQP